jgi:hypothetical protein
VFIGCFEWLHDDWGLFAFKVHRIQIEIFDNIIVAKDERVDDVLAIDERSSFHFIALLKQNHGRQLLAQGRRIDKMSSCNIGITVGVDFSEFKIFQVAVFVRQLGEYGREINAGYDINKN